MSDEYSGSVRLILAGDIYLNCCRALGIEPTDDLRIVFARGWHAGFACGQEGERERCFGVATKHAQDASEAPYKAFEDTHVDGYLDAANDIASAIYEQGKS